MACGVCGKSGHNSRTCSEPQTSSKGSPKVQSGPSASPTKQSCSVCGVPGHNSRTCVKNEAKTCPSSTRGSSSKKPTDDIASIGRGKRSFSTNAASLPVDDIRDLISTIREIKGNTKNGPPTGAGTEIEKKGKPKSETSKTGSKTSHVTPKKAVATPLTTKGKETPNPPEIPIRSKKSSKIPLGKNWLNPEALERLEYGPTNCDGPGYIYMYRDSFSKAINDKNMKILYKIGRSKNLPQKRVRVQERNNKAEYDIVFSIETPYNVLTEGVIHKQLEDYHSPKEDGDGKTEWFLGVRDNFQETIRKVVREVKFQFPEE